MKSFMWKNSFYLNSKRRRNHWNETISFLLLIIIIHHVTGKGAKVRPGKRPNNLREKNRLPVYHGASSTSTTEEKLNYLTSYFFRNASHEERLLAFLFRDYDPVARAVMDTDRPVDVSIDFVLLRIHGLEERGQVLTTTGLVIAEWTDDRLTWSPQQFGNLKDIILKADKIWLPELAVMNGAEELVPDFERIRVLLYHTGKLHWEPGGIFRTTCDIDITYFPFDTQHCPILIGAYSYYSIKMNITNATNSVSVHDFQQNGEWHIHSTSAAWNITILDCCPGKGYPHVIFTLNLKRRYKFYMMNIVLPCLMLSTLIMIGFFLPPEAGEKISLGISVLLAFTVFLLMIADSIPRTSLAIPLIVVYLMTTMTLGTISICMTVLVLNIHHRPSKERPSFFLRNFILIYIACLVRIKNSSFKIKLKLRKEEVIWKRRPINSGGRGGGGSNYLQVNGAIGNTERMRSKNQTNFRKIQTNGPRNLMKKKSTSSSQLHHHRNHHNHSTAALLFSNSLSAFCNPEESHVCDETSREEEEEEVDYSAEWREMAYVLDRFFSWIICIMMTSSTVFILLYPKYTGIEGSW